MKTSFLILVILSLFCTGCVTGSTLRTARILKPGEVEISAGVAGIDGFMSEVVIGACGISENIELEGRWEDHYVSMTPRLQLLKSENSIIDCLAFFELGYGKFKGVQWGPGIIMGKRWTYLEPYVSYRFRDFCAVSDDQKYENYIYEDLCEYGHLHYVKFGNRFHIPCFWTDDPDLRTTKWFIGVEVGPTIVGSDVLFEWAVNIGFDY